LQNGASYSSENGGCIVFNPSQSQYASSNSGPLSTTYTVESWFYYSNTGGNNNTYIVTQNLINNSPLNFTLGFPIFTTPGTFGLMRYAGNDPYFFNSGTTSLTPNQWYHIVGTCNGSTLSFFVNGVFKSSGTFSFNPGNNGNGSINLMSDYVKGNHVGGKLAIVRIYNTALTETQINTNYMTEKSRFGL
jgi:hypothetical protein